MNSVMFKGFGISIVRKGDAFYIRYDAGDLGCCMIEHAISEAEAGLAMESKEGAYQVIVSAQHREGYAW